MSRTFRIVVAMLATVTAAAVSCAVLGTLEAYRYDPRAGGDDLGYFWATIVWLLAVLLTAVTATVWWWGRRRSGARRDLADEAVPGSRR